MMPRRVLAAAFAVAAALAATLPLSAAAADGPRPVPAELPPPVGGPVVLTVEGADGQRSFTLAELEAIGLHAMTIDLVWVGEGGTYHGILLSDLLEAVGLADAPGVDVHAVDGYHAEIPREDWQRWPILLATRRDGELMTVRDKGPTRILYPMTPDEVLASDKMDVRWVWMVERIKRVPAEPGGPS